MAPLNLEVFRLFFDGFSCSAPLLACLAREGTPPSEIGQRRRPKMAELEIVSAGRIQFDEDGEPVGFEEQRFRRDGASIAPLTPGEGPPADGASEERPDFHDPADTARLSSHLRPADTAGLSSHRDCAECETATRRGTAPDVILF